MRIGLFGGSFDPVHYGHLLLAEACREHARLDRVIFMPAGVPPHKRHSKRTPGVLRAEMLELATHGNPAFEISRFEIEREGPSFTVDTLRHLHAEHPEDELLLIVGADMFLDLPNWYEVKEILELSTPIVARRPGSPTPSAEMLRDLISDKNRLGELAGNVVDMPRIDLSSTDMRSRIASGRSIRYHTPRAVEEFIRKHGLYRGD